MKNQLLDQLQEKNITQVKGYGASIRNDNSVSYEEILIEALGVIIYVSTNWDTDEVVVSEKSLVMKSADEEYDFVDINNLLNICGKKLGWYWVGKNSQGYSDMLCFSFDGISPSLIFLAMGSAIEINVMAPLSLTKEK